MKNFTKTLTSVFLCFILVLSLSGCSEVQKAESAVNNMFTAFKNLDFDEAQKYINVEDIKISELEEDGSATSDYDMFMRALFNKLDYKIISSEKIDNDTVNVTTEITAVDMKPVLTDYFTEALKYAFSTMFDDPQPTEEETAEKMEEIFFNSASKADLALVTNEVVIKVINVDGNWKIVSDDALANALFGGLISATEELANSFGV